MNRKNIKQLVNDLNNAGIVSTVKEKIINLSSSEKKELVINGNDYKIDGATFVIGNDFTIEICECEGCEIYAGDNCKIDMYVHEGVIRAGNSCKIRSEHNIDIIAKNNNNITSGENSRIKVEDYNEITTLNSFVNIDGGKCNEVVIGTDFEYGSYVEYTVNLGENSKVYFGSTSINIK